MYYSQKSADDTILTGLIKNDQDLNYKVKINSFVSWCDGNHLVLNISKTKEMVINFRRQKYNPETIIVTKEKEEERMETFKYLGISLDNKLKWKNNTVVIVSKIKTRIY